MASHKIILVDTDLSYLFRLQIKLLEGVKDGVEIDSISDAEYLKSFFSVPRDAGCLIISESAFTDDLLKHNIDSVVLLTEGNTEVLDDDRKITRIHKYSSLNQIFNQIKTVLNESLVIDQKTDAQVITFYSASGGVGKSTLALSMSGYLADKHYRVLHIDTESVQSLSSYLNDKSTVPDRVMMEIEMNSAEVYELLKGYIRKDSFSYIPQFPAPLSFYDMSDGLYPTLVRQACESRQYDYIIVDTDSVFERDTTEILKQSDIVFFIVNSDKTILETSDRFLNVIDKRPGQYVFIDNNSPEDLAAEKTAQTSITVDQYVPHFEGTGRAMVDAMSKSDYVLKMSLLIE